MTCLFVDTLSLTANAKMIVHRCPVQSEEVALQYFYGYKSISIEGISRDQKKIWNHPPYQWQNLILIYLMKMIKMLALLQ